MPLNCALYKQRSRIERMFGHLKINRAIAARYEQLEGDHWHRARGCHEQINWTTIRFICSASPMAKPPFVHFAVSRLSF